MKITNHRCECDEKRRDMMGVTYKPPILIITTWPDYIRLLISTSYISNMNNSFWAMHAFDLVGEISEVRHVSMKMLTRSQV